MTLDFTLNKYAELCLKIQELQRKTMTVTQFIKAKQPQQPIVILRHDIDRSLSRAVRMAELEASYGIQSTYYARTTRAVSKPELLEYLVQLGHELGYHYETLARAKGNYKRAIELFTDELKILRQIGPIETISMHGSPLLPWNNLDLWQSYDYKLYGVQEVYLSIDYQKAYYFSDTGRSWNSNHYNLRDHVDSLLPDSSIHTTDDLITFLRQQLDGPVLINVHPNRWTKGTLEYILQVGQDTFINFIKVGLLIIRKRDSVYS